MDILELPYIYTVQITFSVIPNKANHFTNTFKYNNENF